MEFRFEKMDSFQIVGLSGYDTPEALNGDSLTPLWRKFMDEYNPRLFRGGGEKSLYSKPFYQAAAYSYSGKTIIGSQYCGIRPEGMDMETIPSAVWTVFTIHSPTGFPHVPEAYTRILTEWFPSSCYNRDKTIPNLEVYPAGDVFHPEYAWEIWMPVQERRS